MSDGKNCPEQMPLWEGHPASPTALPGEEGGETTLAISGRRCAALLRDSGPVGSLLRTCLASFRPAYSTRYAWRWKILATPSGRYVFRLLPSGRPTGETAFSLWPTPMASDATGGPLKNVSEKRMRRGLKLREIIHGPLNPEWIEWLMGFPVGWTELGPSEMP